MTLPLLSVLIPSYNRPTIVAETLDRLLTHLVYPGPVEVLISEDGGQEAFAATFEACEPVGRRHAAVQGGHERRPLLFVGPQRGLGANLNHLMTLARADLLLGLDDDHHLLGPLDMTPHAEALLADERIGYVRLMGVGGHRYSAFLVEWGGGHYWRLDWGGPELYVPSFRPHLRHRRFNLHYGPYPEGLRLGATEEAWCHQCKDHALKVGGPAVVVPLEQRDGLWAHVGDSWQLRGL